MPRNTASRAISENPKRWTHGRRTADSRVDARLKPLSYSENNSDKSSKQSSFGPFVHTQGEWNELLQFARHRAIPFAARAPAIQGRQVSFDVSELIHALPTMRKQQNAEGPCPWRLPTKQLTQFLLH
jgi:hypothetical protein